MLNDQVRIKKAAEILGVTPQTLRNWDASGRLVARRSPGGQRYYDAQDLQRYLIDIKKLGFAWATSGQPPKLESDQYCERQDRFTSRLEKMTVVLRSTLGDSATDIVSLLALVAGEIGDNSFAHNAGSWPDVPGVFFAYDPAKRLIVLSDRGQGVRATLQRIRPAIANDMDALRTAFTEIVSGRDPEQRGNGLKVVRSVVESNEISLEFRSGLAMCRIPKEKGKTMRISQADSNVRGAFAVITF